MFDGPQRFVVSSRTTLSPSLPLPGFAHPFPRLSFPVTPGGKPFGPAEISGQSLRLLPVGNRTGKRCFPYLFQDRFHLRTGRNPQSQDVVAREKGGAFCRVRKHGSKIHDPLRRRAAGGRYERVQMIRILPPAKDRLDPGMGISQHPQVHEP